MYFTYTKAQFDTRRPCQISPERERTEPETRQTTPYFPSVLGYIWDTDYLQIQTFRSILWNIPLVARLLILTDERIGANSSMSPRYDPKQLLVRFRNDFSYIGTVKVVMPSNSSISWSPVVGFIVGSKLSELSTSGLAPPGVDHIVSDLSQVRTLW